MSLRVPVNPELLHWALRRSGRTPENLSDHFKLRGGCSSRRAVRKRDIELRLGINEKTEKPHEQS